MVHATCTVLKNSTSQVIVFGKYVYCQMCALNTVEVNEQT